MEIKLDIPEYNRDSGLKSHWEYGSEITVKEISGEILISANQAGLVSLAIQLLTMAQNAAPSGSHFHLNDNNGLEEGSKELIIQKD